MGGKLTPPIPLFFLYTNQNPRPTMAKKTTARKKASPKRGTSKVAQISKKAKAIRKPGEKWLTAIKRAAKLV